MLICPCMGTLSLTSKEESVYFNLRALAWGYERFKTIDYTTLTFNQDHEHLKR